MAKGLHAADVEAIERATLDAVPPESVAQEGGWLLGLDHGTVGRAHSAVPLSHAPGDHAFLLDRVEARYAAEGLRAVFRVPAAAAFDDVRTALSRRGHARGKPTCTFTGTLAAMGAFGARAGASPSAAELLAEPDDDWRALFLGEGADLADGNSRVAILARARHAVYARVRTEGRTVAVGMGSYSHGWASVHGMRTLAPFRGRGLATAVLGALAREGRARGLENVFLQVDASNTGAQALYRRAGFDRAWDYEYWTAPD